MKLDAQVGAQLGAQVTLGTDDAMPAAADTALLRDLMERHGLDSKSLAADAGLDQGYFSRIVSGQYPLSLTLARVLWRRTSDPALLQYLLGDAHRIELIEAWKLDVRGSDRAGLCAAAMASCASATTNAFTALFGKTPSDIDAAGTAVGTIGSAVADLMRLREALRRPVPLPEARTGRPAELASTELHQPRHYSGPAPMANPTAHLVDARA